MADIPDEIESFLSGPKTVSYRDDCYFDTSSQQWIPEKELDKIKGKNSSVCLDVHFVIQVSPSAAARCRCCGRNISKGDLRLGYPVTDSRGNYGAITAWVHIPCSKTVVQQAVKELTLGETAVLSVSSTSGTENRRTTTIFPRVEGETNISDAFNDDASSIKEEASQQAVSSSQPDNLLTTCPLVKDLNIKHEALTDNITLKIVNHEKRENEHLIDTEVLLSLTSSLFYNWNVLDEESRALLIEYASKANSKDEENTIEPSSEVLNNMVRRNLIERMPSPHELSTPLLPFQEEGLAWMFKQEESVTRGGILADEMGMGKTIQMIALLLVRKFCVSNSITLKKNNREINTAGHGCTLVISPLAAVLQWKAEIEKFTTSNTLRVLVYHGANRDALLQELHLYDVVLTTYATVESDYRRIVNTHKVACKYCGRMYLPEKLRFHQKYFCGPMATRTARQAKTEKKENAATIKAMKTLNIGDNDDENFVPTITNVFRSIMKEANADIPSCVPWLSTRGKGLYSGEKKRFRDSPSTNEDKTLKKKAQIEPKEDVFLNELPDEYIEGLSTLISMGYSDKLARTALIAAKGDIDRALAILKEEGNDFNKNIKVVVVDEQEEHLESSSGVNKSQQVAMLRSKLRLSETEIRNKRVVDLQKLLQSIDQPTFGTKAELVNRLLLLLYPQTEEEMTSSSSLSFSGSLLNDTCVDIESLEDKRQSNFYEDKVKTCSKTNTNYNICTEHIHDNVGTEQKNNNRNNKRKVQQTNIQPKITHKMKSNKSDNSVEHLSTTSLKKKNNKTSKAGTKKKNDVSESIVSLESAKSKKSSRPIRSCRKTKQPSPLKNKKTFAVLEDDLLSISDDTSSFEVESEDDDVSSCSLSTSSSVSLNNNFFSLEVNSSSESVKEKFGLLKQKKNDFKQKKQHEKEKAYSRNNKKESEVIKKEEKISAKIKDYDNRDDEEDGQKTSPLLSSDDDPDVDLSLSPLHSIVWRRIVLDEAHRIKSRTTSTAKAACALKSSGTKWCLTGTPLQNRVGELYSLVRFLKMDPYAYYFCQKKGCDCKSLHYRFVENRYCIKCNHGRLMHFSYFNRKIVTPIKNYGYQHEGKEAMRVLKQEVLDRILLRRTKLERAADVQLPSLTILIRRDPLIPAERDFYESLYKQTRIQFNTYVEEGTVLHNYAHIFDLLSRLRQAVDHPYLIVYGNLSSTMNAANTAVIPAPGRGDSDVCGLCQDDIGDTELVVSNCKHAFHRQCIIQYMEAAPTTAERNGSSKASLGCPTCYCLLTIDLGSKYNTSPTRSTPTTITEEDDVSSVNNDLNIFPETPAPPRRSGILGRFKVSDFKSSTKIEALVQELAQLTETDAEAKSIVFSQYTFMLELIEWRLKKGGFNCVKLVGSLSLAARTNILYAFNTDQNLKIILISLKAGGEGLNLQIANNVFLMDPWWNPASELQAIQRAHRIGQKKPVRAVRFICENTIEEKMLQLQEKKQLVFDGTIGASDAAMARLTADDLRFLFQN